MVMKIKSFIIITNSVGFPGSSVWLYDYKKKKKMSEMSAAVFILLRLPHSILFPVPRNDPLIFA